MFLHYCSLKTKFSLKIRCYNNITQAHYVISESFYVLFQLFIKTGSSLIVTFFYIKSNFDLKSWFFFCFFTRCTMKKDTEYSKSIFVESNNCLLQKFYMVLTPLFFGISNLTVIEIEFFFLCTFRFCSNQGLDETSCLANWWRF